MGNYYTRSEAEQLVRYLVSDPIAFFVALGLYFGWIWLLYSRFGYRGKARLFLSLTSLFPAFFAVNLVIVSLITSPNETELEKLRKQVKPQGRGIKG
jgi:hypothetical protein